MIPRKAEPSLERRAQFRSRKTPGLAGIHHQLLRIPDPEALVTSPARSNSFEGFMIEQIVALENLHISGSGFYFFRTHAGAEIDLLIDRGILVYNGTRAFAPHEKIRVIPAPEILTTSAKW